MKRPSSCPMLSELGEVSVPQADSSRRNFSMFASQPGSLWEEQLATQGRIERFPTQQIGTAPVDEADENAFLNRIRASKFVKYIDGIVLNYDAEAIVGYGVFWAAATAASVLRKCSMLRDCLLTWLFCAVCFTMVLFLSTEKRPNDALHMKELVMDFHQICTFLLGFFISTCISRWWVIRQDGIGGLWGNLDDICMLVNALFPQNTKEDRDVRELVLRWGTLSHELMYKQIRNSHHLNDLVDQGLLLPNELTIIQNLSSRPQVVWAWMCHYFVHLAYGDPKAGGSRLPHAVTLLPQLLGFACKARDAIGLLFTITDSQLPFRYVHFLSMIVWIHNLIQALASAVIMEQYWSIQDYWGIAREVVFLLVYPMLYLGLLHLGAGLLNPMRSASDVDYPRAAFTFYMLAENRSFFASTAPPHGPPYAPNNPPVWVKHIASRSDLS